MEHFTDEWDGKESGSGFFAGLLIAVAVFSIMVYGVLLWQS